MMSAFEAEMMLQLIDVGKQVLVFGLELGLVLLVLEHVVAVVKGKRKRK